MLLRRSLRRTWLTAVLVVLLTPAVAWAGPPAAGRVLPPSVRLDGVTGGDATGQGWYRALTRPASDPHADCVDYGRTGRILLALGDQPQQCTIEQGTAVLVIGLTAFCDSTLPPPTPRTVAAQARCAWDDLESVSTSVRLTVDGGKPLELRDRRFAICSPQRGVRLPPGNILGVEPQRATFTACGWVAWLADLPVGRHSATTVARGVGGEVLHTWAPTIQVVPRH